MRRVVITGIGLVTPLGTGKEKAWKNLLEGECGIDKITQFDSSQHPVHIAAEVKDFVPENYIEKKELKKIARFSQFAIAASKEALEDAKLEITDENADRIGVIIGSGIGGLDVIEQEVEKLVTRGPKRVSPFYIPAAILNMASGNTSIYIGAKGPNKTVVTACASGTNSIGDAFQAILLGKADAMIAGGTEATVTPSGIAGFANLKALSTNPDPKTASRPFTADRDGFVLGEGAGVLVLEELEHAKRRGARIYAELAGFGASSDAYHITAPNAEGPALALSRAIKDSGLPVEAIDYVNAHGTSTPLGDANETNATKAVFGEHAKKLVVSSTKSMTGHLLGAAGGVEAVYSVLAIRDQIAPPTINLVNQDFDAGCDLDYCANTARKLEINAVASNSFGFGGTNGTLVFKKFSG